MQQPTQNELEDQYKQLSTEELIELLRHEELTELGQSVCQSELEKRGIDTKTIIKEANQPISKEEPISQNTTRIVVALFLAFILGGIALLTALIFSDGYRVPTEVIVSVFCVVYLIAGVICGMRWPQLFWSSVVALNMPLWLFSVFIIIPNLLQGQREPHDLLLLVLLTAGAFFSAYLGVWVGTKKHKHG